MTTLGLNERIERVLAYSLFWVSGIVLLLIEKNQNVRWHALQSVLIFGTLSLLIFAVSMLDMTLSWIPLLGWFTSFGLGLLLRILWWTFFIAWIWLLVMAWLHPRYRLPLIHEWFHKLF
ncbi:DUF4870 domain-containing protein [Dictyobacter arantiisoli]|uniref:Membrane protein n=1 Tax=Dictyobacter arantiisoli TaxID=2014874 RepID=A0A5A5TDJ1_9CHLR|nr:hypothetical protein [Dictyobacter arantiisoli]GCF09348.1 membrane protein [Dictyobacter arantiisoli]